MNEAAASRSADAGMHSSTALTVYQSRNAMNDTARGHDVNEAAAAATALTVTHVTDMAGAEVVMLDGLEEEEAEEVHACCTTPQ